MSGSDESVADQEIDLRPGIEVMQREECLRILVVGTAREMTDAEEKRRLEHLRLGPWCPGPKEHWIRVESQAITGRRIPVHHELHRT